MPPTGVVGPGLTWPAGITGRVPGPPWVKATLPPVGVNVVFGSETFNDSGVAVSSPVPATPSGSVMMVFTLAVKVRVRVCSRVFEPAIETHALTGIALLPVVSRPRL